ncbi:hypothetical protein DSECCO2_581630 [anaerobic digester metagenome]
MSTLSSTTSIPFLSKVAIYLSYEFCVSASKMLGVVTFGKLISALLMMTSALLEPPLASGPYDWVCIALIPCSMAASAIMMAASITPCPPDPLSLNSNLSNITVSSFILKFVNYNLIAFCVLRFRIIVEFTYKYFVFCLFRILFQNLHIYTVVF